MQLAFLVAAGVTVAALLAGFVLRRFGSVWGARLQLTGGILARLVAGGAFAREALAAFERGGAWLDLLGLLLAALALGTLALAAVLLWALVVRTELVD